MNQPSGSSEATSLRRDPYRAIFEDAPDGIVVVDGVGKIVEVNPEAVRLFGYDRDEMLGSSVELLVPERLRTAHRASRNEYGRHPQARPMGVGLALTGVRKDGVTFPVEISLSPLGTAEELRVVAIIRDLTERSRLRQFGVGALRAAEEERRRIARELHDDTAQTLAALLVRLRVLEQKVGRGPEGSEISDLRHQLHSAAEGVRRIARGLRPPELEDVGLAAALRSFVRERFNAERIELSFDGSERRFNAEEGLIVYRIAQEALSNAARHARAGRIRLEIRGEEDSKAVLLKVSDDGCGFDRRRMTDRTAGLGLYGMEERAQLLEGQIEIHSREGEGTTVKVRIPFEAEK